MKILKKIQEKQKEKPNQRKNSIMIHVIRITITNYPIGDSIDKLKGTLKKIIKNK